MWEGLTSELLSLYIKTGIRYAQSCNFTTKKGGTMDTILIHGLKHERNDISEECVRGFVQLFTNATSGSDVYRGEELLRDLIGGCKKANWDAELVLTGRVIAETFNRCVELSTPVSIKDLGFPILAILLGQIGTKEAIEALKNGVFMGGNDSDYLFVREYAGKSLAEIGGQEIKSFLEGVTHWDNPDSPRAVARWALTQING